MHPSACFSTSDCQHLGIGISCQLRFGGKESSVPDERRISNEFDPSEAWFRQRVDSSSHLHALRVFLSVGGSFSSTQALRSRRNVTADACSDGIVELRRNGSWKVQALQDLKRVRFVHPSVFQARGAIHTLWFTAIRRQRCDGDIYRIAGGSVPREGAFLLEWTPSDASDHLSSKTKRERKRIDASEGERKGGKTAAPVGPRDVHGRVGVRRRVRSILRSRARRYGIRSKLRLLRATRARARFVRRAWRGSASRFRRSSSIPSSVSSEGIDGCRARSTIASIDERGAIASRIHYSGCRPGGLRRKGGGRSFRLTVRKDLGPGRTHGIPTSGAGRCCCRCW